MKVKYYKDADLLSLKVSSKPYQYARQDGDFIVHYSQDKEPVLIEIVNAVKFLKDTTRLLPKKIQREITSTRSSSVAHRIK